MAANPRDILIRPIITEKTSQMMQENKYTFQVPLDANKVEIKSQAFNNYQFTSCYFSRQCAAKS